MKNVICCSEVVNNGNPHNHNYRVNVDIPLFYGTMGVEELWIRKSILTGSSTLWASMRSRKLR